MRIKTLLRDVLGWKTSCKYKKYYKSLLVRNAIPNIEVEGEAAWIEKWSVLGKADPIYFRLFSRYIGPDLNIISEDICRNVVEPILDPLKYVPYYSDKNMFDKLFPEGTMPQTLLRKMCGFYYDDKYHRIELQCDSDLKGILDSVPYSKIVVKPTVESSSGNGVRLFERCDKEWCDMSTGEKLSVELLETHYGDNLIVQECLEQADFMAYYNSTSVNTLRLTLYRSVKTDLCHIPSAIIRIGSRGALVDNAHAGGGYVGIHADGRLCHRVLNQYGQTIEDFNGIDFSQEHKIPNWERIVEFAKMVGRNVPHHRLLALDIMVDKSGEPRLVEFNCEYYSMWLFQFTMGPALGEFTDEVIAYCKQNMGKAQKLVRL